MKKYLIYSTARTGSVRYAMLLSEYLTKNLKESKHTIFYSLDNVEPKWEFPIQHTHQIGVVENCPKDFTFLLTTRSILDSVISSYVGDKTKIYALFSNNEKELYEKKYKNFQFDINALEFKLRVEFYDNCYSKILKIYNKIDIEKYIISYNECANNEVMFFKKIGIDIPPNLNFNSTKKMPIDKFSMITNLQEILQIYKNIEIKNNFEDSITIDKIEKLLDNTDKKL